MVATLNYGRETIEYEVRFLASRQTLGIEVHPDRRVLVRAPADCSPALIAARVQKRASWISKQLAEFDRYRPRTPARQFVSGESHLYLGRQYRLKIVRGAAAQVKLTRGELLVMLSGEADSERVRVLLRRWYLGRARMLFRDVVDVGLLRFRNIEPPRVIVRAMKSRWGSLSPAGTMTLNVDLVRAPRRCIEYVVCHELCHVAHRDHDARFYRLLGRVMPDWEKRKQRLEEALL